MRQVLSALLLVLAASLAQAAPVVRLLAPSAAMRIAPGSSITLSAEASDAESTIARVDFYAGGQLLGSASSAPYTLEWSAVPAGRYNVSARAVAASRARAVSAPVRVVANTPPTIVLAAGTMVDPLLAPADLPLTAQVSDAEDGVARVRFYRDGELVATATEAPYTAALSGLAPGQHRLVARVTDSFNDTVASNVVTVKVANPVSVAMRTPAARARFSPAQPLPLAAEAASPTGTIALVEFFADGQLVASADHAPFEASWSGAPAGRHALTARATDSHGFVRTSAPVHVVVNTPPAIRLVSSAAALVAPASVGLSAEVTDAEGAVAKVQFYNGSTLLATLTQPPFVFTWPDVGVGSYTLHARVVDGLGGAAVSAPLAINVSAPNVAPRVGLAAPAPDARLDAGTALMLRAEASDADGRIAQVEFFADGRSLGSVAAPPYELSWRPGTPGNVQLSARATDAAGASTMSAAIAVRVIHPPAAIYYIHLDHLGTPRVITSEAGQPVWNWDSDPFGVLPPNEDPRGTGASFRCNLRFPGQYFDAETGLHYNYLRDYDPASGRYVQSDPRGLRGGLNTYLYGNANPLQNIDPTGEIALLIPVAMAAAEGAAGWALPAAAGLAMGAALITPGDTSLDTQRKQENDDYHRICDEKNPSGDRCQDARKDKERAELCYAMRESFANKWFGGTFDRGHQIQMNEVLGRIRNADRRIRKYCECS